jgi:transposase-like protein
MTSKRIDGAADEGGRTKPRSRPEEAGRDVHLDKSSRTSAPRRSSRVREAIEPDSTVYTDLWRSYTGLERDYDHKGIDHAEDYIDGRVHTNRIENFWSRLKRGLHGTYISVEPFHLFRYLDERVFTYNLRKRTDAERDSSPCSPPSRVAGSRGPNSWASGEGRPGTRIGRTSRALFLFSPLFV